MGDHLAQPRLAAGPSSLAKPTFGTLQAHRRSSEAMQTLAPRRSRNVEIMSLGWNGLPLVGGPGIHC